MVEWSGNLRQDFKTEEEEIKMNRDHIDLCSGIGGFRLGFSWSDLETNLKLLCDI